MPISDWSPEVASIGAILRARTKDKTGNEIGTFTPDTRPTDAQIVEQIDIANGKIVSVHSEELPEFAWPSAKRAAALQSAMLVELSYYPEQVATGKSPYDELKALYEEEMANLTKRIEGEDLGDDEGGYGYPSYAFPEDVGGLVGWGTRF